LIIGFEDIVPSRRISRGVIGPVGGVPGARAAGRGSTLPADGIAVGDGSIEIGGAPHYTCVGVGIDVAPGGGRSTRWVGEMGGVGCGLGWSPCWR
jgi:hypothetical protein